MTQVNEYKYGATHEFRGNQTFMDKHAEKILKKHGVQIHSIETLPDEKEVIFHVSGSVEAINKASSSLYDEANGDHVLKATPYKPPKFMGSTKKIVQEEVEMQNLSDVLINIGVKLTEEQITELDKTSKGIHSSDMRKMKHELDARDHEGRGDWGAAKKSWKNAGLSAIKGDAARKHNTNLSLQVRGKSVKDDVSDLLASLGIELTEEQDTQLNTYLEEADVELTNELILETGPEIILSSITDESEDADEIFDTVLTAKVETLLDNLRMEMASGMFATEEEEVEVTTEDFVEGFAELGITLSEEQINKLETEEIEAILTEEQLAELKKSTVASYKAKLPMSIAKDAGNAVEAGKIGRTGTQKRLEHRALKRVGTVSKMLSPKPKKSTAEDITDMLADIGVNLSEEQLNELGKFFNPPEGFKKTGVQAGKPLAPKLRKGTFVSTKPKVAPKKSAAPVSYPRPVPGKKN